MWGARSLPDLAPHRARRLPTGHVHLLELRAVVEEVVHPDPALVLIDSEPLVDHVLELGDQDCSVLVLPGQVGVEERADELVDPSTIGNLGGGNVGGVDFDVHEQLLVVEPANILSLIVGFWPHHSFLFYTHETIIYTVR